MLSVNAKDFYKDPYKKANIDQLNAMPEKYKNKKVVITTSYLKFHTTFPAYIEKSGLKPEKKYGIIIGLKNLFAFSDKKGVFNEIIPTLKKGSQVILYGKIKKFSKDPGNRSKMMPRYYIELAHMEVSIVNNNKNKEDKINNRKKSGFGRKRRN